MVVLRMVSRFFFGLFRFRSTRYNLESLVYFEILNYLQKPKPERGRKWRKISSNFLNDRWLKVCHSYRILKERSIMEHNTYVACVSIRFWPVELGHRWAWTVERTPWGTARWEQLWPIFGFEKKKHRSSLSGGAKRNDRFGSDHRKFFLVPWSSRSPKAFHGSNVVTEISQSHSAFGRISCLNSDGFFTDFLVVRDLCMAFSTHLQRIGSESNWVYRSLVKSFWHPLVLHGWSVPYTWYGIWSESFIVYWWVHL